MLPAISVVIPAFNEAARIGATLAGTISYLRRESPASELIVVDDGSMDNTAAQARQAMETAPEPLRTRLLKNDVNRGKGAAVRQGLLAAREPIAVFFDADLSTPIEELPRIIEPITRGEADIAFGSRALDRSLIGARQPWRREQAGIFYNFLVRLATGLPFVDTQCGFKAFRVQACRHLLAAAKIDGFGFDVELLLLGQRAGLKLREIPVRWNHHEGSKVQIVRDSLNMLREVAMLRRNVNAGSYDAALQSAMPTTLRQGYSSPGSS